jgi:hypothetical protein
MKREELIKWVFQSTDAGTRNTDTFLGFPFNIASYATLAKILEEITLFVALGVEGNLKNAFISMTKQ